MNNNSGISSAFVRIPAAICLTILLCACQVYQTGQITLPAEIPKKFSNSGTAVNPRWWESFGDEQLNRLTEKTLSDNLDPTAAWGRLRSNQYKDHLDRCNELKVHCMRIIGFPNTSFPIPDTPFPTSPSGIFHPLNTFPTQLIYLSWLIIV